MINLLIAPNRDASLFLAFEADGFLMLHNQQNNHPGSACQFFLSFLNKYDYIHSVLMQVTVINQT